MGYRTNLKVAFTLLALVTLFFFEGFTSHLHAVAFRITRPLSIPPEYVDQMYPYARVGYGAGVFAVFGDYIYVDTLWNPYSQVYVTRVTPQGQVLDSLPILVTLKMDGGWKNQNTCWTLDGPPFDGTNFLLTFGHDSLSPNPISISRIGPSGPLLDSVGVAPADYGDQINNGCAFGDSTYLMSWVGRRPPAMRRVCCAARVRRDRTSPDSIGFLVDLRDTSITPVDNISSVSYNGSVFLVVWGDYPGKVWAARVSEAGVVLDTVPILVHKDLVEDTNPQVASDGRDFFMIFLAWDTLKNKRYVAGARVSDSGVVLDTIPIRISRNSLQPLRSPMGLTFNGYDYQTVWAARDTVDGYVFGARISPSGIVKDTVQPRLFPTSLRPQGRPAAATAPGGRVLVVWTAGFNPHIYGAFLDTTGREVGVEELHEPPGGKYVEASLAQPLPNPMRNQGEIAFSLPAPGKARLAVYDALGRKVRELLDRKLEAGSHALRWDGRDAKGDPLPSGVYFLRLEAGKVNLTRKLVVLR